MICRGKNQISKLPIQERGELFRALGRATSLIFQSGFQIFHLRIDNHVSTLFLSSFRSFIFTLLRNMAFTRVAAVTGANKGIGR